MSTGQKRKERKNQVISVRLTDEELAELHDLMKNLRIKKMSDLVPRLMAMIRMHPFVVPDSVPKMDRSLRH